MLEEQFGVPLAGLFMICNNFILFPGD
jgi:hypothetical protein